jgi:hypothetical protein
MNTATLPSKELVGTFRRFGTEGPVYEILAVADPESLHIVVVESGETLIYPTKKALRDPEAD